MVECHWGVAGERAVPADLVVGDKSSAGSRLYFSVFRGAGVFPASEKGGKRDEGGFTFD